MLFACATVGGQFVRRAAKIIEGRKEGRKEGIKVNPLALVTDGKKPDSPHANQGHDNDYLTLITTNRAHPTSRQRNTIWRRMPKRDTAAWKPRRRLVAHEANEGWPAHHLDIWHTPENGQHVLRTSNPYCDTRPQKLQPLRGRPLYQGRSYYSVLLFFFAHLADDIVRRHLR